MIAALFYLQFHSVKNRLWSQCRRLKKPKYLAGALVGGLYCYFFFFRPLLFQQPPRSTGISAISPENLILVEMLSSVALMVIVVMAWLMPHERAALTFTEAEIAFLFPAPISRRGLIHFKLLKSQLTILASSFFLTLFSGRFSSPGTAWLMGAGWWLILCTLNLHFLGSSFAVTRLIEMGVTPWKRRFTALAAVAVLVGAVFFWAGQTLPAPDWRKFTNLKSIQDYLFMVLGTGPAFYLLYPFRIMVRPLLAQNVYSFILAAGPVLVLMALHYVWVVRSNVSFEEASLALSQKRAAIVANARKGNWAASPSLKKRRGAPFSLAATGFPGTAILWKNLINAGQLFNWRLWLVFGAIGLSISISICASSRGTGWTAAFGAVIAGALGWSLLAGPQILRQDLRQDLAVADILKSYPLRGWEVVLGELLAPTVILTCLEWFLLLLAVVLLQQLPKGEAISLSVRLSVGLGAAILLPSLILLNLMIPNATALLFPSWFRSGAERPHGIEATGQQLIFMFGQILVLLLSLVPAALAFTVVFFSMKYFLGWMIAVPLSSLAASVVLGIESAAGILFLGRVFERYDLSAET